MKKWILLGIVGVLALGAQGVAFTSTAFAQDDAPVGDSSTWFGHRRGPGFGHGRGMGDGVLIQTAAEMLGMTEDELTTQLWGGKTLADLAEEKGVALEDIQAAVDEARDQAFRESIEQAVADETITQEYADWLIEGLNKGFLGKFGPDGRGFHMHPFGPEPAPADGTGG